MTVMWVTSKDFTQLFKYKKMGLTKLDNFTHLVLELIVSKVFYYFYMIVLPMLVLDIPWWAVFLLLLVEAYDRRLYIGNNLCTWLMLCQKQLSPACGYED